MTTEELRKQLDDAGVRKLVKFGPGTVNERLWQYGRCELCRAVRNYVSKVWLDENDCVHASTDLVCLCGDS
jgi:hypothetical protein